MRILWHWQTMGPYHFTRMNALAQLPGVELIAIETAAVDDHEWVRAESQSHFRTITMSSGPKSKRLAKQTRGKLARSIEEFKPNVIVASGYHEPHALSVILSYRSRRPETLAILWSESTAADRSRKWLKDVVKRCLIGAFDGALVAGGPHSSFLQDLGMSSHNIQVVGNCVDNEFFSRRSEEVKCTARDSNLPQNFFVFVGRFIPEKNISGLIEAFRLYRQGAGADAWDLVLVGSGPQEAVLRKQVADSGLAGVYFAGLRQLEELPQYYGRAKCLVLPSSSEPWGLVVNEAMASSLPVIVSSRCGCATELVRNGVNGFVFEPTDVQQLATLLSKLSNGSLSLEAMGAVGRELVGAFSPSRFALRALKHLQRLSEQKVLGSSATRSRPSGRLTRSRGKLIAATWACFYK